MNSTENSTSDSRSLLSDSASLTIIFNTVVLILSFAGNVLVLSAVCLKPRFSRPANFMLANLCVTSLCQVFAVLSGIVVKIYPIVSFGPWTCYLFPVVRGCALPAEGFTAMCISFERSKASIRPLERMNGRKTAEKILVIWVSSLILELPHGLFWKYADDAPSFRKCVNVMTLLKARYRLTQANCILMILGACIYFVQTKELYGSIATYAVYICCHFLVAEVLPICFMLKELLLLASRLKFLMSSETEWSEYQVCKYMLIRNALIFIVIFICFKLPAHLVFFIHRMPEGIFPQSVSDWVADWKNIMYQIGIVNFAVYPLMIFALSNKIRELFTCFLQAPRRPPIQTVYCMRVRRQPLAI